MLHEEDGNNPTNTSRSNEDARTRPSSWLLHLLDPAHAEEDYVPDWIRGLTKTQAEDLLDWLEVHGVAGELIYEDGSGFAVRPVPKCDVVDE